MEAFLPLKFNPMNVFSSGMKFLLEVPSMIFAGDSSMTSRASLSSGSSLDSPRFLALALNVFRMAPVDPSSVNVLKHYHTQIKHFFISPKPIALPILKIFAAVIVAKS
jgi:hypothetical protein